MQSKRFFPQKPITGLAFLVFLSSSFLFGQEDDLDILVVEGPKIKWDLSLWGTSRPGTRVADVMAEKLDQYTDGQWELKIHYGEGLSKARENLDGISIGAFDAAMICNIYHPKKNPGLMVLALPFLPIDDWQDHVAARQAVYEHEQIKKEFKRWGAQIYSSSFLPHYEIMGRGDPPITLEDWKGKTVRAGGGIDDVLQKLGATPSGSTAPEVYSGLQTGAIDAAAFPFTYSHVSYRLHEVSDWFTSNLSPGTTDCPIVLSIQAYDNLPQQYRDLLKTIKPSVIEQQRLAYVEADRVNLPMLRKELTEVAYSDEELEQFRNKYGREVIEEWIQANEKDFDARGLVKLVFKSLGHEY